MEKVNGIWIFVEINNNEIHYSTFELLAKARQLSEVNQEKVVAIVLGSSDYNDTLIGYGADEVIVVADEAYRDYNPMLYRDAVVELANKYQPSILMLAATHMGRSLAPLIQGGLMTGLTADVLDLRINADNKLEQIKPSYGDNLMCTIIVPDAYPQMCTVRPNVFTALDFDDSRSGNVITEDIISNNEHTFEVLKRERIAVSADSIVEAERIVAVGRGIKNQDNLVYINDLAETLKAKVGVTRPLAENGWYTLDEQIGQSGVSVSPKLLLNFGIAGAVQYTVGMTNADFVFSVNTDENASIFKESDYGYLGDAKDFAQQLIKALNK